MSAAKSMTRKDFRSAARQLSEGSDDKLLRRSTAARRTKEDVVYEFVKFLRQTNSNFDSSRFIKACREGERKRDAHSGDGQ